MTMQHWELLSHTLIVLTAIVVGGSIVKMITRKVCELVKPNQISAKTQENANALHNLAQ